MTYEQVPGWFDSNDVKVYSELLEQLPDGGCFAELGVAKGRSICSVAEIIKRKNLHCFAVDTFEGTENEGTAHADAKTTDWEAIYRSNIARFGLTEQVTVLRMRTDQAHQLIGDGTLDLVFIDAAHDADSVESDINLWKPKLKPTGILSFHDWTWPSVREGIGRTGLNVVSDSNFAFLLPATGHSSKPLWSVCLICRNEEKTLPRAIQSLKPFMARGGEVVLVDTSSTDRSVEVARAGGFKVHEAGTKFLMELDKETADGINSRFCVDGEPNVVNEGDKIFDFASARNFCSSLATNDHISWMDCDEDFTVLDIDKINSYIQQGWDAFTYNFVFAHYPDGSPSVQFVQSKMHDRRKQKWVGITHEVLQGPSRIKHLERNELLLEHFQNLETNRSGYLKGLALDCYQNPDNDRNSHYFAREMYWTGRPKSAIKEFERHVEMRRWPAEAAQSLNFIGQAYIQLGEHGKAVEAWHRALATDATRREPLIRLAEHYSRLGDHLRTVLYASASLQLPYADYYANDMAHYRHVPHQLLYIAYWYLGRREESREQYLKALEYFPEDPRMLKEAQFYFPLPKVSILLPQLGRPEGFEKIKASIEALNYPKELVELIVDEREEPTVPEKVRDMALKSTGGYLMYVANDLELDPRCLIQAVLCSLRTGKGLVALNDAPLLPDKGNECAHFLISRELKDQLENGEIFSTDFTHVGCDNWLLTQAKQKDAFIRCELAKATHHHFSRDSKYDWVYDRGWKHADKDRETLKLKLLALGV